jgi:hypothetical protein
MYDVLGRCPLCNQDLIVTRLHCRHCDLTLEGHFALGRFARLTSEQLHFVETFIRCEGKLNRMQDELGLSYPTVRSRLHDVIRALGYQVEEEPGMLPEERRDILEKLAQGVISSDEAIKLLQGS